MNLFESAEYAESISHCSKRPVGAAIELNNRVVSIGWNHGTTEKCNCRPTGQENPDCLHAEIVAFFSEDDFCFKGGVMALTYLPCLQCAELIAKKGIAEIYYRDHRIESKKQKGIDFLIAKNIKVSHFWEGRERVLNTVNDEVLKWK